MSKIIIISGGKGGVGKSTISLGVIDLLLARGEHVTIIEGDNSNPDVAKVVNGQPNTQVYAADMDSDDGYILMANAIEGARGYVIINTPARGLTPLIEHWAIIDDVAKATKRETVILFPVNRQRDSLELLRRQIDGSQGAPVFAVLNTYFGSPEKFTLFNGSRVKTDCSGVLNWPEMNDRISDRLTNDRIRLSDADAHFTIAERSVIRRYRADVNAALNGVI